MTKPLPIKKINEIEMNKAVNPTCGSIYPSNRINGQKVNGGMKMAKQYNMTTKSKSYLIILFHY